MDSKTIGYLVLVATVAALAINIWRMMLQTKMIDAVCKHMDLDC